MSAEEYTDDGIMNLAYALLSSAKDECMASVEAGDYIGARVKADMNTRGIVGKILQFATGDSTFLEEYINKEIENFSQLKRW